MRNRITIGLVGDHNESVVAHRAIPVAFNLTAKLLQIDIGCAWLPTQQILDVAPLQRFDGFWCVPASPYRSMEGALLAISHARTSGTPFLGTCGGFQHAVIEYARNVLGWKDADHGEVAPNSTRTVIAPLTCALVEAEGAVHLAPGTRIASAYGVADSQERYHCSYGINPAFQEALVAGPLRVSARDDAGEIRAVELVDHPFFVATLFQPERAALEGIAPPLVISFARACAG